MAKTPTEIRSLARGHTRKAVAVLAKIMANEDCAPAARVAAASAILDRGWGKPTQPIAGDEDGAPIALSVIKRVIVDPKADADPGD